MKNSKITYNLALLYKKHRKSLPAKFEWEDEQERWYELVFCLMFEVTQLPYFQARVINQELIKNELAGLGTVAELAKKSSTARENYKKSVQKTFGTAAPTEISGAFADALIDLGASIKSRYGKPQIFLRKYGQEMVNELGKTFQSKGVSDKLKGKVFVNWLNSVLEMPLLYSDKPMADYCRENNCSRNDLVAAADELDIDVGVIDDLIYVEGLKRSKKKTA